MIRLTSNKLFIHFVSAAKRNTLHFVAHSPDNTFLGFAVGSGKSEKNIKKKNQAVIYGKVAGYLQVRIVFF